MVSAEADMAKPDASAVAASSAEIPLRRMPVSPPKRLIMCFPPALAARGSNAQICVQLVRVRRDLAVLDHIDDRAVLDHVMAVGDGRGESEILLDQQNGEPLGLQGPDHLADAMDDDRS